jgi:nitroreductase
MIPIILAAMLLGAGNGGDAQPQEPRKIEMVLLPAPKLDKGLPLMQTLKSRRSVRSYSSTMPMDQQLSELLWAANGLSRENGKRTAPAALISAGCLSQNVSLYCASERLGSVARGSIDPKAFREAAGLAPDQIVLFAQTVGAPK